jgi:RimJ/RimL family protein N-acetyltransferase
MVKLIEFETERLRLRQWLPADREPFAALNADPKVMEFFPATLDRAASDAMADRGESLIAEQGWGFWATEIKKNAQFIGFVGLHITAPELPFSPCVEIGWRLAFQYWGKGFATEAAQGSLQIGFDLLDLPEIVSFTTVGNIRSRAVMRRLGMREDVDTFEHPKIPTGHPLRLHCLYRLPREQWLSARNTSILRLDKP